MSTDDSSLRTGSNWLAFVTGGKDVRLLGNSRNREIGQNMSTDDSSLRTGSNWLAFLTDGKGVRGLKIL